MILENAKARAPNLFSLLVPIQRLKVKKEKNILGSNFINEYLIPSTIPHNTDVLRLNF